VPLAGRTASVLSLTNVGPADAGTYRVRVLAPEGGGEALSADALLEVVERQGEPGALSADKLEDLFGDEEVEPAGAPVLHRHRRISGPVSIGLPGTQFTDNSLATRSAGDPAVLGLPTHATRWFRMRFDRLPGSGSVRLTTAGSSIPTLLAIFTNRLDLRLVAQDAAEWPAKAAATVWLKPERGVDYLAMVDGRDGAVGTIHFNLGNEEVTSPPVSGWKDGRLFLQFILPAGEYQLDGGETLQAWQPVERRRVEDGVYRFLDEEAPRAPARFYRVFRIR
jgi:hypothetical protein